MNISCYIFGNFGGKYTQYPDDKTCELFSKCVELSQEESQMVVHREERLMHYVYIQRLNDNRDSYIGLCASTASMMITDFESVFDILSSSILKVAVVGKILDFNSGEITPQTNQLYKHEAEILALFRQIMDDLDRLQQSIAALPDIRYGINKDSYNICKLSDTQEKTLENVNKYGYLVINNDKKEVPEINEVDTILNSVPLKPRKKKKTLDNKDKVIIFLIILLIIETIILIIK